MSSAFRRASGRCVSGTGSPAISEPRAASESGGAPNPEPRWSGHACPPRGVQARLRVLATTALTLLLFMLAACAVDVPTAGATSVLVDASRDGGAWWAPQPTPGPFDPSAPHQGKAFADFMRGMGLEVTELPRGDTQITSSLLLGNKLVVVPAVGDGTYSGSEIAAYSQFVSDGGSLILLESVASPDTSLVSAFGLHFSGSIHGTLTDFVAHPITAGVSDITSYFGQIVDTSPCAATTLGSVSGSPAMGIMPFGNGWVFYLGDFYAPVLSLPQPFVSNLITYMLSPTPALAALTAAPPDCGFIDWTTPGGGSYADVANWNDGHGPVPEGGYRARFSIGNATYGVSFLSDASSASATVGNGDNVTFDPLSGVTYSLTGTDGLSVDNAALSVDGGGNVRLVSNSQIGGATGTAFLRVSGAMHVDQSNSSQSAELRIGSETSAGTTTIENGASFTLDRLAIGRFAGPQSTLMVRGLGSDLDIARTLEVSKQGSSSITVDDHARVSAGSPDAMTVADDPGSSASVTIENGSDFDYGPFLLMGKHGTVALTLQGPGTLLHGQNDMSLAYDVGSTVNCTVSDGAGVKVEVGNLLVGNAAGPGTRANATVLVDSHAEVTVQGGPRGIVIGPGSNSTGSLTGRTGASISAGIIRVGGSAGGQGTFGLESGAHAAIGALLVGSESGSTGTVSVSGRDPVSASSSKIVMTGSDINVGTEGAGTLQVTDGGAVILSQGGYGLGIGNGAHGTGLVTVGSSTSNSSLLADSQRVPEAALKMGQGHDGNSTVRLEVLPGGEAVFGAGVIGRKAPITGLLNSTESILVRTGSLSFAYSTVDFGEPPDSDAVHDYALCLYGGANLLVDSQGQLTSRTVVMGPVEGLVPTAYVTGVGSYWKAGPIFLSYAGRADLHIDSGGRLDCDVIQVAGNGNLFVTNGGMINTTEDAGVGVPIRWFPTLPNSIAASAMVDHSTWSIGKRLIVGPFLEGIGTGTLGLNSGAVIAHDVLVQFGGSVVGSGTLSGATTVTDDGTIAPGVLLVPPPMATGRRTAALARTQLLAADVSPGTLHLHGAYEQDADAVMILNVYRDSTGAIVTDHIAFDSSTLFEGAITFNFVDGAQPRDLQTLHVTDFFQREPGSAGAFDLSNEVLQGNLDGQTFEVDLTPQGGFHVPVTDVHRLEPPPTRFALNGSFPNPFESVTSIRFDLARPASVRLEIFDVTGRLVRVLMNGLQKSEGRYSAAWDGRGDDGAYTKAGIYLCRLIAGSFVATRPVTRLN